MLRKKIGLSLTALALLGSAGAAGAAGAAPISGQLDFNAELTSGTCVATFPEATLTHPSFTDAEIQPKPNNDKLSYIIREIKVDGCSNAITEGTLTYNFNQDGYDGVALPNTQAKGFILEMRSGDSSYVIRNGFQEKFEIKNGSGSYKFQSILRRKFTGASTAGETVKAGSFTSTPIIATLSTQ